MEAWIVFATWLCFSIVTASSFTTIPYTSNGASVGSYQMFMTSLRRELSSRTTNNNILVTRRPSTITNQNRYLLVQLTGANAGETITMALNMENAYFIGYKTNDGRSFFFKDSPTNIEAANSGLFDGTTKVRVQGLDTHYTSLGDRTKIPLGIMTPMRNAINNLRLFNGVVTTSIRESVLVLIQVVSEAARFKVLQRAIEANINDAFRPKGVVISYQNSWDAISLQVQTAGADGRFRTPVQLQNEDFTPRTVSTVAEVKSDMGLLHYNGPQIFGNHNNSVGAGDLLREQLPAAL
ncbi:ribosome-inactivating protein gelonin-like [Euphorbia lathyris]|uniref:ribosome-inactivating protein gelonin-like n=1 Tax=Euphorbia lathyris TaxID=212925 RepID=UPI00331371B5